MLLWLYITCFIIIIGAEINAIIHQRHVIKGKTPEEAALEHDDNNQNHYNENTTYEYNDETSTAKETNYEVDKNAEALEDEDKESIKDVIIDKFTSNDKNSKLIISFNVSYLASNLKKPNYVVKSIIRLLN